MFNSEFIELHFINITANLHTFTSDLSFILFFYLQTENSKKNRFVNALPYDHARVVLNELANLSGSDYINASTIVSFLLFVISWMYVGTNFLKFKDY